MNYVCLVVLKKTNYIQQINLKKIIIEDDVWIGAGAVIMPGVRLSKGTVVGANAVVLKSTNPYEVVAGIPSKTLYVR
jgi:acetyltransferase-like isoleucine patch superfamily enzyme